jgi:excisionase family DNA binding protein
VAQIPKLYLNLKEAAAAVGVSHTTLARAIREGRLRAKRSGKHADGGPTGKYLISIPALQQWFDELPDA